MLPATKHPELRLVSASRPTPVLAYLGTLDARTSRPTMEHALEQAARTLSSGAAGAHELPWHELRYEHTTRLQTTMREQGYAPQTINRMLSAVRGVLYHCRRQGLMTHEQYEDAIDFKSVRSSRLPAGRAVESLELDALFAACRADRTAAGVRDAAILAVLVGAGLRRDEVAKLLLEDVSVGAGEIRVLEAKGNKDRVAYAGRDALFAVALWIRLRGEQPGALFCPVTKAGRIELRAMSAQAIYNMCAKRAEQAGIKHFSPHDMRRTFISELLDRGADLVKVQRLVGHANVQTTARYDRRGNRGLREAADLLRLATVAR